MRSMGSIVCVGRDEDMGYSRGGTASGPHRMVTGTLKTRKKKEGKKEASEKKAWRRRDGGLELLGGFGRSE